MIPSQFYPTTHTDDYTTNVLELTGNIYSQSDYSTKFVDGYYLGYIKRENIPVCFNLTTVTYDAETETFKSELANSDENADFLYAYGETDGIQAMALTRTSQGNYVQNTRMFNSLAPLQPYSKSWGTFLSIIVVNVVRYWTDPTNPSTYYTQYTVSVSNSTDVYKWLKNEGTLNFTYYRPDSSSRTKDISITDIDDTGKIEWTEEDGSTTYDNNLFIIGVYYQSGLYYYDANGYSGNTNLTPNRTKQALHLTDTDGTDYFFSPSEQGQTAYILSIGKPGTGYSPSISGVDGLTINNKNYMFHAVFDDLNVNALNPNVVRRLGNAYIVFYDEITNFYRYSIVVPWTANDIRFWLALYPCLNDGSESGRYLPRIVDNELTGEFFNYYALDDLGTDWQKSADITDDDYTEYDKPHPTPEDDGEDDTRKRNDTTNLPQVEGVRLVSGTGFSSFYLLSSYHVAELGQLLSQMPASFWEAIGTATDYKMSNLLDYISALKWYPINISASAPAMYPDVQTSDIQFGFNVIAKVSLSSAGTSYKLGTVNRVFDMGSVYIPYRTAQQTFLDEEPYTDVYANLPYIGKVQLQANLVLGYTITCYYIIDLITGIATCFLDNGYDTIYTGSGKIGVDISVAGNDIITQSERMSTAYIGTVTHAISNALSIGGNVVAENAAGAIDGTSNMISGLVADSIATANAKRGVPQVVGSGSGFGSTYADQTPVIIVQRPAVKIPAGYGHSIGYIANTRSRIGSLSGFTVCNNPDLSGIAATSAEIDMIRTILCSGFYA